MNESSEIRQDDPLDSSVEKPSSLSMPAGVSNAEGKPKPADRKRVTVRVEYKHSLATRWMHWINFLLLFVMFYCSTEGRVYRSADDGLRWQELGVQWNRGTLTEHAIDMAITEER
jgi:hypothetical protein